jgi:hypothetical protein
VLNLRWLRWQLLSAALSSDKSTVASLASPVQCFWMLDASGRHTFSAACFRFL